MAACVLVVMYWTCFSALAAHAQKLPDMETIQFTHMCDTFFILVHEFSNIADLNQNVSPWSEEKNGCVVYLLYNIYEL